LTVVADTCVAVVVGFFGLAVLAHRVAFAQLATICIHLESGFAGQVAGKGWALALAFGLFIKDRPANGGVACVIEAARACLRVFGPPVPIGAAFAHGLTNFTSFGACGLGAGEVSLSVTDTEVAAVVGWSL